MMQATTSTCAISETGRQTGAIGGAFGAWPLMMSARRQSNRQACYFFGNAASQMVKGAVLPDCAVGAIEMMSSQSQSATSARKLRTLAQNKSDNSDEAEKTFGVMQTAFNITTTVGDDGELSVCQRRS